MTLGFSTCGAALPTILSLNAFAAFGAAVVLYVLACLLFFWILEEVNRKQAPADEISRFSVHARLSATTRLGNRQVRPASNVANIVQGCKDQRNGTLCSTK
jgi:hypothetical protein